LIAEALERVNVVAFAAPAPMDTVFRVIDRQAQGGLILIQTVEPSLVAPLAEKITFQPGGEVSEGVLPPASDVKLELVLPIIITPATLPVVHS